MAKLREIVADTMIDAGMEYVFTISRWRLL